jgi:hypothetical protein
MQQPADYCDQARLDRLIKEIQEGYRRLIAVRDASNSPAKGRPVMTHTYDYPTPRNAPARFLTTPLVGPWLYQAFTRAEVPEGAWLELAEYFIDRLAEGLLALSNSDNPLPNFHVVDSRGLLHRARLGTEGESGDWLNEIHPRRSGYEKLAKAWEKKITALLKPRPRSVKR